MAATLADVAARAGVSSATVSRVLNGNYPVAERTRERVLAAVTELHYVVNAHARALAASRSDVIGVVVNDISDPYFGTMADAVQGEAAAADLLALICSTAGSPEEELRYVRLLLRQRVRSIVLTGGRREDPGYLAELTALLRQAADGDTDVVLCGRPPLPGTHAVALQFDDRYGVAELTRHLLDAGHRRVACIEGPERNSTAAARLAGYREAMGGLATRVLPGGFDRESGYRAARALLAEPAGERPTAIVAANDLAALGVLAAARESGVRVPQDLSVAGYDDIPFAADAYPALTTVYVPLTEAGTRAGRLATARDPRPPSGEILLRPRLVPRDSVAPPLL
ncbi:LacI family DNA-binding transcriptional regulator [Phaeacidiphilus oryzae]|uniref:LacI family DNA-binding transcriptional regulator n=1 Tax=Phaeacidiphilus oryzae TaxID=348818 RepID=UPI0005693B5A|nr:LacI family DNA-binding transcriptional regulator [Phaeacidiphilus oryzae]